ncbi:MAG TPA: DUF262 domain-containing protein [Candidatus Paceibacterota bacterium]|nr:DUF262 domain-containing protein [Candidatus Paceibacterota bacterium]
MDIKLKNIKVREVVNGYKDDGENGVVGYNGKLNIRPPFQREFIYGEKERDAVIKTLRQGFPLNTMYWSIDPDGNYELMDGQQRTVSICQYITEIIPIRFNDGHELAFTSLTTDQREQILNYPLSVYICNGTPSEKLSWFRTINIAGKPLTDQELLNAMHTGPWLTDAKRWFSKTSAPAVQDGRDKLVNGSPIRQEILATALKWISNNSIENYMNLHKDDNDAQELWQYWQSVFDWVNRIFPNQDSNRTKLMKGLEWGNFYNEYKNKKLNAKDLENQIIKLINDDEVENKKGIYEYLLTRNERTLSLRQFDDKIKVKKYEEQKGICSDCQKRGNKKKWEIEEMEADHIIPWSKGGKTIYENCQMLCIQDNRIKSGK